MTTHPAPEAPGPPTEGPPAESSPAGDASLAARRVRPAAGGAPALWERGLSLLAVVALFLALGPVWASSAVAAPGRGAVLTGVYGLLLLLALLVLTVRGRRALLLVDLGVLAAGGVRAVCGFAAALPGSWYGTDEGVLIHQAALLVAHGGNPYTASWPHQVSVPGVGATPLMGGGSADTYGYPPLPALLTAAALPFTHGRPTASFVAFICELLAAALLFVLLPAGWKPVAALLCFGLGYLDPYARQGYAVVMALPLLVVAVASWADTGRPNPGERAGVPGGGPRLGRAGVLRALCLGLAAATQQLAWFLAPFLLLGIWLARRSDSGTRAATRLSLRWAALAAAAWLAVDLPFAVRAPRAWLTGITAPLTQHAVPKGVGLVGISVYLRGGSGALDWYGYAAALLLLAGLAALLLAPRRIGPAAVLLPWLPFYLATRSTDNYFTLLSPLWLLGLATAGPAVFAGVRTALPRRLLRSARAFPAREGGSAPLRALRAAAVRRPVRAAALAALALPAAVCIGVAVLSPAPLRLRVLAESGAQGVPGVPARVTVEAVNRSDRPVRPHFGLSSTTVLGAFWTVRSGPAELAPGARTRYVLAAPHRRAGLDRSGPLWLRAVSADPMTLSSVRVPRTGR